MPSPFPGTNPYLESSTIWSSFHIRLLVAIADTLAPVLRPSYWAASSTNFSDTQGIFCSRQFPELWLASEALVSGNLGEVLRVLAQGISRPQHREFVASL